MAEFLQEYWMLLVVAAIAVIGGLYVIIKEPQRIKQWLIWACSQAELALGSGTGMLKLREVYNMFITQYPIFSKFISFETFQKWTEEALETFKKWLESNPSAQELFTPVERDVNEEA